MRRRAATFPRRFFAAGAATIALAAALVLTVGNLRAPAEAMNPAALQHIEAQNRRAAVKAATVLRIESAKAAEAADRAVALNEATGDAAANTLARFESQEPAVGTR